MAIKTYKPITPSLRQRITLIKPKSDIKLSKYLFADEDKYDIKAGRNNTGRITIRRRGGRSSHKRKLRKIDRGRELGQYSLCKVLDILYDPNISGNIALLEPIKDIELYKNDNTIGIDKDTLKGNIKGEYSIQFGDTLKDNIKGTLKNTLKDSIKGTLENYPFPFQGFSGTIKKDIITNNSTLKNYLMTNKEFGVNQDNKIKYLILAPEGLKKGDIIKGLYLNKLINESHNLDLYSTLTTELASCSLLSKLAAGTLIYNLQIKQGKNSLNKVSEIETLKYKKNLNSKIRGLSSIIMNPYNKGIYARAAGTYCILLKTIIEEKSGEQKSIIRLPSNKLITIPSDSLASIGQVSNPDYNLIVKGKAGVNRWLGIRPRVRGEAMNIVDHPMGGATQGSGGRGKPKKTAWGKLAKWTKRKISK